VFAIWLPFVWIAAWIAASIFYRRVSDKPLIPRAPTNATFKESWISGRSLKNILTRIGGARHCLLVYVADDRLTIVPCFPFDLMFLPEIYGLEITAPLRTVSVTEKDGLLGSSTIVSVDGQNFQLHVRNYEALRRAVEQA